MNVEYNFNYLIPWTYNN